MTFDNWFELYAPTAPETLDDCAKDAWKAGAAIRDAEVAELKAEIEEEVAIREQLAKLLAETAIALKGEEVALIKHSWHDLGWCAAEVVHERDKLRNQVTLLRDALKYSRHQCEGLRVWGGMSWTYHPFQAKRIFDTCEEALAIQPDDSALKAWLGEQSSRVKG